MILTEEQQNLVNSHLNFYNRLKKSIEIRLSRQQGLRCCCGRLATGLHELTCAKFKDKVTKEAIRELEEVINKSNIS